MSSGVPADAVLAEALRREREFTSLLIESSTNGILAFDRELRYTLWNPAMERMSGLSRDQVVGRTLEELFPAAREAGVERCMTAALRGEWASLHGVPCHIPQTGRSGYYEAHYSPLRNEAGEIVGGLAFLQDVTGRKHAEEASRQLQEEQEARRAAEQAEQRATFLARASALFTASLDYATIQEELARLVLPEFADYCLILDAAQPDQEPRYVLAHALPEKERLFRELIDQYPPSAGYPSPARRALETGTGVLLPEMPPDFWDAVRAAPRQAELLEALEIRSVIAAPLIARGRCLGVLEFFRGNGRHSFTEEDLALATELGKFAALALDNARLYEEALHAREAATAANEALQAIIRTSPVAIVTMDREGIIQSWNPAAERIYGWSALEAVGRRMPSVPPEKEAEFLETVARQFRGETITGLELCRRRKDGSPIDILLSCAPLRDASGRIVAALGVAEEITDRKRAEREILRLNQDLQRRVEEFQTLLEVLPVGIGVAHDSRCQQITVNPAFARALGIREDQNASLTAPEEERPQSFRVLRNGEEIPPEQLPMQVAAREGRLIEAMELEVLHTAGRKVELLEYAAPFFDEEGHPRGCVGVFVDISARVRAEERLRFLAQAGSVLASSLDTGATLQNLAHLVVPELADWCTVHLQGEDGTVRAEVVAHTDPEKERAAREELARHPYSESAPQGIAAVLRTGKPILVPEVRDEDLVRAARDEAHLELLRSMSFKSALYVPLLARGRRLGVLGLFYTETDRRYAPEDLTFAEEIAARAALAVDNARLFQELRETDRRKDEFIAMLSHELRNPLASIGNAGYVLDRMLADHDQSAGMRGILRRQTAYLTRMVDDLLDLGRITSGRIELRRAPVDLVTIARQAMDTVDPLVRERRHTLVLALGEGPLVVEADGTRMEQVLVNLLTNAAKYTDPGGEIRLLLETVREAREGSAAAAIRVRDNGQGIPPELLPTVFDLFTQGSRTLDRSQGGLGIGLTLVKRLVELHGGEVEARSPGAGAGSEFVVRLPLAPVCGGTAASADGVPVHASPSTVDGAAASPGGALRVLVVEDNADVATTLEDALAYWGHHVRVASDGPAAIAALEEFAPHVALLDIGLPGMSGYEVARRLREAQGKHHAAGPGADRRRPDRLILVALTGYGREEDRQRAFEAGIDHHLTKPVDTDALKRLLESMGRTRT